MIDYEQWFRLTTRNYQINSVQVYKDLSPQIRTRVAQNQTISEIIDWLVDETKHRFLQVTQIPKPTDGALNNTIGRWNEFIIMTQLCEAVIELSDKKNLCIAAFSLPNSTIPTRLSLKTKFPAFLELFNQSALAYIPDRGQGIFFSSPDCIISIIHNSEIARTVKDLMVRQIHDPGRTDIFKYLKGKLDLSEVRAAISIKTSNRPDRRYQPSFEAAMIKAISKASCQSWKYYMVTNQFNHSDNILFKNLRTPVSITTGQPERLVDALFVYQRKADLLPLLESAIS